MTRDLNFRKLTYINNSSSIFAGCISLVLAFLNFGVWSLVFNSVATYAAALPMFFFATGWKPKLIWDKEAFQDIFGFGINTMGTQVFNNLINKFVFSERERHLVYVDASQTNVTLMLALETLGLSSCPINCLTSKVEK